MRNVLRASDLIGLPVVSILSGEDVAEVRDVVYDSEAHQLRGGRRDRLDRSHSDGRRRSSMLLGEN